MALEEVTVPTLIMFHREDACVATLAADASKLQTRLRQARKVEVALLDGGAPPESDDCDALSPHGYFGIEAQAVDTIAAFVSANSR
jgi:hypothetical protein